MLVVVGAVDPVDVVPELVVCDPVVPGEVVSLVDPVPVVAGEVVTAVDPVPVVPVAVLD
jgi:hypothetical protein